MECWCGRTRKVGWMPILTQRGIYEKVNSVEAAGNSWQMIVKEIGSDLSVLATAPLQGSLSLALSLSLSLSLSLARSLSLSSSVYEELARCTADVNGAQLKVPNI